MNHPLLEQFVSEVADLLDEVDLGLLRLEQHPGDVELINEIFRAAHTLKGSSGLFDFPELTALTHAAEDLLQAVRAGQLELGGTAVDLLLAGFDQIRLWMAQIEVSGVLPADAAGVGLALAGRLRAPLGGQAGPGAGSLPAPPSRVSRRAPSWLLLVPRPVLQALVTWLNTTGASIAALRYRPDAGCFFRGEDPLHLVRQIPAVEHLEIRGGEPLPGIAQLAEFDCLLEFTVLTRSQPGELAHLFRYVPAQVEVAQVDGPALERLLAQDLPDPLDPAPDLDARLGMARDLLLAQQAVLSGAAGDGWQARIRSAATSAALAAVLAGEDPAPGESRLRSALADHDVAPLRDWIEELQARCGFPAGARDAGAAADHQSMDAATGPQQPVGRAPRLLKVDQAKVDRLMDLAGELVVAKNALPFVATEAEDSGQQVLARRVTDEYTVISRISEELQQALMDVRMMAVAVAFARIPRLVRDLARAFGKNVRLVQEGQDAAADKDIIEALAEPLVHLVRNSLDHGIESPAERQAAGKPPEATLLLRAVPDGDAVVVEIADDGRGIDLAAVRRQAHERGLIAATADEDVLRLLFEPGFSTARALSDVSGRGVGLDAVKAAVEFLGGTVTVTSRPGAGTAVRLRLPLTMAVSRVLLLTADGQRLGVQVDDVIETVSVPPAEVQFAAGQRVLVLRQQLVPLAWLSTLLGLPADPGDSADPDLQVLVVATSTGPLGLVVDRFQRDTDVILKPLEGLVAGTPGYCGTALLGDGRVLLVLDVKELNERAAAAR